MRNLIMALSAASLAIPVTMAVPTSPAEARHHHHYRHQETYREYRGRDGRMYCRRSDGTTGTIVGGVGGAAVGAALTGGGAVGTLLGAAGGALAGRSIDRHRSERRCR